MSRVVTFEEADQLTGQLQHWAYNAADAAGTRAIANVLLPRLKGRKLRQYATYRAFQNVAFAISRRGILVDRERRSGVIDMLNGEIDAALVAVDALPLVREVWDGEAKETGACPTPARKDGKHKWEPWEKDKDEHGRVCTACGAPRFKPAPLNANSSEQVYHLLYDLLGIPPQMNKKRAFSVDDEVLTRLANRPPNNTLRATRRRWREVEELIGWEPDDVRDGAGVRHVRSLKKQLGEVKAPLDEYGRYQTTINIAAAWTGRSSSSRGYQGKGGNTQNKAERIRPMFVADPGFELAYADLKQAESLDLAHEAEDENYITAHKEDLHTYVTRIIFTELPWTGDMAKDKALAKQNPPWDPAPGHDRRWYTKRNSHGYGYGVSPAGTARIVHGSVAAAAEAHGKLDLAFPGIKERYHRGIQERVRQGLPIITPLGREIPLLGRPWDAATWRQGYSLSPQATVSDLVWIAGYWIYRDLDPHLVQVLGNGYDALLLQWRVEDRDEALREVVKRMEIPVFMPGGRTMTIGVEVAAGHNWGKASKDNPDGLREIY